MADTHIDAHEASASLLSIPFDRNSAPVTDREILAIVDAVRPVLADGRGPCVMHALLLTKLLFRIEELRALAGLSAISRRTMHAETGDALRDAVRPAKESA